MLASYAIVARRAAVPTAIGALIMIVLGAVLVGTKGLIGALVGVAIVTIFLGLSVAVVGWASRISQPAMMIAALATFLVKIVALMVVVSSLVGTTAFSTRTLGFTAIGCILLWSVAQVVTALRVKMLYVDPVTKQ
jgi:ATP synthase protein I